jgi:TonB family protein
MFDRVVSLPAKGLLTCAVAMVQAILLGALSLKAGDAEPPQGGAPVINLSLQPMVAFDSPDGAAEAAASIEREAPAKASARAVVAARVPADAAVASELRVRTAEPTTIVAFGTAVSPLDGETNSTTTEASEAASMASADTRQGMTRGGGGRALGASGGRSIDQYEAEVLRWIERHKGNAGGNSGVVTVGFTLDARGRLRHEWIVAGSGRSAVDALTLRKLREAAPFPRPHSAVAWRTRDFIVNIDYRSHRG